MNSPFHIEVFWNITDGFGIKFHGYELTHELDAHLQGNYIIAKYDSEKNAYFPIYIGEGDIEDRRNFHIRKGCITEKGAGVIFVKSEGSRIRRREIEQQLLEQYPGAYIENGGCNDKKGG